MNTKMEVALELVHAILQAARGADAIVTVCPMCQLNLEGFQKRISREMQREFDVTILYLPQLLGLALGLPPKKLGLELNLAITREFKEKTKTHA
jgi:heterodisulfide reductase subunit B